MIQATLFLDTIRDFIAGELDPDSFCNQFTDFWLQHREAMVTKKQNWSEPYDEKLIKAFQQGEINQNEFSERFALLWGYQDFLPFQNMIDTVHTMCMVFCSNPTNAWEINENQLRLEVSQALTLYESHTTSS